MSNVEAIEIDIRELSKEERESFLTDLDDLLGIYCVRNTMEYEWLPVGKSIPVQILSAEMVEK